jgi:hypothetical protein
MVFLQHRPATCRYRQVIISLDRCKTLGFTYGTIIRTLRKFPQTKVHYQEIRKKYDAKATSRIDSLTTMTVTERYAQLKETQPWVFSLVEEADIASYLGISVKCYVPYNFNAYQEPAALNRFIFQYIVAAQGKHKF